MLPSHSGACACTSSKPCRVSSLKPLSDLACVHAGCWQCEWERKYRPLQWNRKWKLQSGWCAAVLQCLCVDMLSRRHAVSDHPKTCCISLASRVLSSFEYSTSELDQLTCAGKTCTAHASTCAPKEVYALPALHLKLQKCLCRSKHRQ